MQEVNVGDIDIDYAADDYLASLAGYEVQGDGFTLLQAADAFQQIARVIAEYGETVTAQQIKDYVYSFDEEAPYDGYLGQYWFDNVGDAVGIDFGMYHIVDGEKKVHLGDEHAYI